MTGVNKRDDYMRPLAGSVRARDLSYDSTFLKGLSFFWGFGAIETKIVRCMKEDYPFFHLDHAYFNRGYSNGNCRVSYRHFHTTKLLDVPDDRVALTGKSLGDWKTGGKHIVLIEPSERICSVLYNVKGVAGTPKDWLRKAEHILRKSTDRPIVVKKKSGSLIEVLKGAHALVSLSSVAEVEAALHGIPVFTSEDSPAAPISEKDLSKIETPIYPEREGWLRSLSYANFSIDDIKSGRLYSILKNLYK